MADDPLLADPQHTPGPWHGATAGSSLVGIPVVGPRGRAITSLHFCADAVPGGAAYNAEQLANARLIAAAPELFAACKAAEHALLSDDGTIRADAWTLVCAAIEKAKGKP